MRRTLALISSRPPQVVSDPQLIDQGGICMETTRQAASRAPTDALRTTALVAGILYLLTFAASIPAVFLMGPVLTNPDYVLGAGADRQVILGAFLDIITALAGIGTAVALFSVVKRQHEGLAIGFVASRGFEAAVIAVGRRQRPGRRHAAPARSER